MDQDPLPRGSLQVADRLAQVIDVIFELAKPARVPPVAVEAQDATYVTEHVIVVDVFGVRRAADRADAPLTGQEGVELLLPDSVSGYHLMPEGTSTTDSRRDAKPRRESVSFHPLAGTDLAVVGQSIRTTAVTVEFGGW
jgi:hypothetical protein